MSWWMDFKGQVVLCWHIQAGYAAGTYNRRNNSLWSMWSSRGSSMSQDPKRWVPAIPIIQLHSIFDRLYLPGQWVIQSGTFYCMSLPIYPSLPSFPIGTVVDCSPHSSGHIHQNVQNQGWLIKDSHHSSNRPLLSITIGLLVSGKALCSQVQHRETTQNLLSSSLYDCKLCPLSSTLSLLNPLDYLWNTLCLHLKYIFYLDFLCFVFMLFF